MQGTIAQIVALTLHGNSLLQQTVPDEQSLSFYTRISAFAFCESVTFVDLISPAQPQKEQPYASDPREWFEHLLQARVHGIALSHAPSSGASKAPDRMLAAFVGGGGRWLMATTGPDRTDYWSSRWLVGNRERKDRKIWRVTYARVLSTKPKDPPSPEDLQQLKTEVRQALEEIRDFSRPHNLPGFTNAFASGLARLESPAPLEGLYHQDLAPEGFLSLPANQLLGAAEAAWVFGGMGSWNDLGFQGSEQSRYEVVSENLYQLLNRAIVAAANSRSRLS
jgi:hypothetical protein